MRFRIDLTNYSIKQIPSSIIEVDITTIDLKELSNAIAEFNEEIKWDGMWDIIEAENRLRTNWKLILFKPNGVIKGWYWLDNTNEPRNLYVNKDYRNQGVGKNMHLALLNICKKINMSEVICSIDDWNISSIKCIENAGWSAFIE